MTANLLVTQEEERKRIARELHDDVNQKIAMLANEVATMEQTAGSSSPLRQQLRSLHKLVDQLSDDLRRTAHNLHPSALEHFSLVAALESHCSDFSKLHPIQLKLSHSSVPESIPSDISLCLYRVAQECLNNIAKHSGARKATVAIRRDKDGILWSVSDNGRGFDPGLVADQSGLGLVGIRERARLVDGTVSITSQPRKGTRIDIRVPSVKRMAHETDARVAGG